MRALVLHPPGEFFSFLEICVVVIRSAVSVGGMTKRHECVRGRMNGRRYVFQVLFSPRLCNIGYYTFSCQICHCKLLRPSGIVRGRGVGCDWKEVLTVLYISCGTYQMRCIPGWMSGSHARGESQCKNTYSLQFVETIIVIDVYPRISSLMACAFVPLLICVGGLPLAIL
jgi:hypothetical protein